VFGFTLVAPNKSGAIEVISAASSVRDTEIPPPAIA
jgi:hypothetical protein